MSAAEQLNESESMTCALAVLLGYTDPKLLPNGDVACIHRLMYTHAILVLDADPSVAVQTYKDRWCFSDYDKAKAALDFWDGTGEPTGWHRHPATGRRREKGDPATEYVSH